MTANKGRHPLANEKFNQIFKALSHPIRRRIIHALPEDRPCDVATLTLEIADNDHVGPAVTKLRHVHLPYLDDAAVLDWDRETNTLSTDVRYDPARQILQLVEGLQVATP